MSTWPPEAWKIGGGTMWGWIAYDPDLNLIYYGTGNPGPWNQEQRPGDNKWTTSCSRGPRHRRREWAYQTNPHDEHDYDGINEQILLDMTVDGKHAQGAACIPTATDISTWSIAPRARSCRLSRTAS